MSENTSARIFTRWSIKRFVSFLFLSVILSLAFLSTAGVEPFGRTASAGAGGLLVNGNFDELGGFKWFYPNHFVARGWSRWWRNGTVIPEYDDTRTARPHYDGTRAQVYFKWGATYKAGIYQVVGGLAPCRTYKLTMWARNHSIEGTLPHARIGLDPEGKALTSGPGEGGVAELPDNIVWSEEQSTLVKWEQLSVQTEAISTAMTAILYAAPVPPGGKTPYFDTHWDGGYMEVLPAERNRLPEPDNWTPSGFIQNLSYIQEGNTMTVTWETPEPASAQVWYRTIPVQPTPITTTMVVFPHALYLPKVDHTYEQYPCITPIDFTPSTQHELVILGLKEGDILRFVALSRRVLDNTCITEVSHEQEMVIHLPDSGTQKASSVAIGP